jgi:hypothetical protein
MRSIAKCFVFVAAVLSLLVVVSGCASTHPTSKPSTDRGDVGGPYND